MVGLIILAVVAALVLVVIVRAVMFKPTNCEKYEEEDIQINEEKAINDLAEMIRCKTVSYYDDDKIDKSEFEKFRQLLKDLYPTVNEKAELEYLAKTGVLYKVKGKSSEKPSVFMAHYDVVPVEEEYWQKPAFDGLIEDGYLWGRGTLDTKGTLCGVMEAAEYLLSNGFVPENDMYFAFSGEEEVAGATAPDMVKIFEERGIIPEFVIDEGGAVVEGIFPGVSEPCALIGIAEKGMSDIKFSIKSNGGHASAPPPHTIVGTLSKAICDVENNPFKMQITKPVAEMFDTLGRHSSFVYRMIFANLWLFRPVLDMICKKSGGELNALVRTTTAFTQTQGSLASNVLPPSASCVVNVRICGTDTMQSAAQYMRDVIKNDDIQVEVLHGSDPCNTSSTDCEGWYKLKKAISQTWTDAIVSPYLMIAGSDSRHYSRISDKVYRFSAMALSTEERGLIHAHNERIPLEKIVDTVKFYVRLMKQF